MDLKYLAYRMKYRWGKHLPLRKPVDLSLELSSRCTNACGYCYHADPKSLPFKRGFMDTELALGLISEAGRMGVPSIKFNYRGEPTMHPQFRKITEWSKDMNNRHGAFIDRLVNSNFNFRSDRIDIFEGLCNLTKVKVSFDSFIPEIFERQRKGSNYQKTIDNIERFYNWRGRKTELVIQSVRTQANKDEDLEYEIKNRWPEATASVRDVVGGRVNKDLSHVLLNERDLSQRQSCLQAHVRLIVHHDGKVGACCPDIGGKIILGDTNTQTIKEIFNSPKAKLLRKTLKDKSAFKTDPCRTCPSWESFKGYQHPWNS